MINLAELFQLSEDAMADRVYMFNMKHSRMYWDMYRFDTDLNVYVVLVEQKPEPCQFGKEHTWE